MDCNLKRPTAGHSGRCAVWDDVARDVARGGDGHNKPRVARFAHPFNRTLGGVVALEHFGRQWRLGLVIAPSQLDLDLARFHGQNRRQPDRRRQEAPPSRWGLGRFIVSRRPARARACGRQCQVVLSLNRISFDLREDGIDLTIDQVRLGAAIDLKGIADSTDQTLVLTLAATKVRHGHQLRLIIPGLHILNITPATRDEKLVALVAEAHMARKLLAANPVQSIASIAAGHGRCRTRLGKLAALSCLAPDIVTAIVEGRQPPLLTARTLQDIDLPLAWVDQRALLGFV